jgi:hypothetical protein
MAKNYLWKVWLKLNLLTKEVENDYVAEVSTTGRTLRNEDVARLIKDAGSELQYETLLDIINHADRLRRQKVQEGYSVLTGVTHITPRVSGNWIGASAKYDPDAHKITCGMIPSAEMRTALEEVGIEVLGVKDSGAIVSLVTDAYTGNTDGTITPGEDIIIEGDKIKIAPPDEVGLGVFFIAEDGTETQVTNRFTQNDPKRIIVRVPPLVAGNYSLEVRTRFTSGNVLLKDVRSIVYNQLLTV